MANSAASTPNVENWLAEIGLPITERVEDALIVPCFGGCGGRRRVDPEDGKSTCENCKNSLAAIGLTRLQLNVPLAEAREICEKHSLVRVVAGVAPTAGAAANGSPKTKAREGIPRFEQPREILDRDAPFSIRMEMGLLQCILLDPHKLKEVGALQAADFYDRDCRRVYEEMRQLAREGKLVDPELLHDRLVASLALEGGVASFLHKIGETEATAYNAVHYADEIAKKSVQRRVQTSAERMLQLAADNLAASRHHDDWLREVREVAAAATEHPGLGQSIAYDWRTFAELEDDQATQKYLVEDVVTEAQGGLISGRYKSLKTSIAAELFSSMATGQPFLGRFAVAEPVPCALMTAESGPATIREMLCRIAAAKGVTRRELSDRLLISTKLPNLCQDDHLEAVERDIRKYGLQCVAVDPSYLAMSGVGDAAVNVFKMGAALGRITKIIQDTGCTILLLNHSIKGRGKDIGKFEPPELGEVAMAGFAEWARFWILLAAQREWDEHAGRHFLWMRAGGSAGHSGLWSLDITEGRRGDPGGRKWEVEITGAADAARERSREAANKKAAQAERTEAEHVRKLEEALREFPAGETAKKLREVSGLNGTNFGTAIRILLRCGKAATCTVTKRGQDYDGYRPNA